MFRDEYWSNGRLGRWLLHKGGITKPSAATMPGWRAWKKEASKKSPILFWISQVGLNKLQNIIYYIPDKINSFKAYFKNRFVYKTNWLPTGLTAGAYYELDYRMKYGLFELLSDFIECEKAGMYVTTSDEKKYTPRLWDLPIISWFHSFRNPDLGIKYLQWETAQTDGKGHPTRQAKTAQAQLDLYYWWKRVYRSRADSYLLTQMEDITKEINEEFDFDDLTSSQGIIFRQKIDKQKQIDYLYELENEIMMKKMIELRSHLWT